MKWNFTDKPRDRETLSSKSLSVLMCAPVSSCMVLYGHVWSCMVMFGHVWLCMVMYFSYGHKVHCGENGE